MSNGWLLMRMVINMPSIKLRSLMHYLKQSSPLRRGLFSSLAGWGNRCLEKFRASQLWAVLGPEPRPFQPAPNLGGASFPLSSGSWLSVWVTCGKEQCGESKSGSRLPFRMHGWRRILWGLFHALGYNFMGPYSFAFIYWLFLLKYNWHITLY